MGNSVALFLCRFLPMSNLQYKSKREFWRGHTKSFAKVFVGLFIMFAWVFESTLFGAVFWSVMVGGFISGCSIYLSLEDLLPDQEVMKRILSGNWARWK